tara:strand:+ start:6188 stop:7048 length:861 start_codon:yes stop_codon:yes gene_type:complete
MKTVTVATDCITALENWEHSVKENGHDYKILGIGKKWKGWSWRSMLLSDYFKTLKPDTLICITDAYDALILETPQKFINLYDSKGSDLIIGVEHISDESRNYFLESLGIKKPPSSAGEVVPGYYINGGGILGKAGILSKAYKFISRFKDDQVGWKMFLENNKDISVHYDIKCDFILNLVPIPQHANTTFSIGLEFLKYSLSPSLVYDKIEISRGKIFHIKNKSYPLIIHLPGCNYDKNARYNEIIKKLYNDDDKLVEGFTKFTYTNTFRGGLLLLVLLTIYTIKNN